MKSVHDDSSSTSVNHSAIVIPAVSCEAVSPPAACGRGKSQKSLDLVDAARTILKEIQPATVRAVCYRLFTAGLIPNMGKNATGAVSKQLVWARETGLIDWAWIVDETREAERIAAWGSPDEVIDCAVRQYRRDNWRDQPHWIEVWSEKGTVRGTLAPVLKKYGITLRVMHGFGSASALYDIAEESLRSAKPLTILYVGDFDPSGMEMSERDIPSRIARYQGQATIRRIALTIDDVREEDCHGKPVLPFFEAATKKSDSRHKWFVDRYGSKCWELDAMSPAVLRDRLESVVVAMLNIDMWNRALMTERAEINALNHYVVGWRESISRLGAKYSNDESEVA